MTRLFRSTRKYDKLFKSLNTKLSKQATKAMEAYMVNPSHPSLRFKKIQGTSNFYEISVNMSIRIVIEITSEGSDQINTFFIIGPHDDVFPPK